MARLAQRHEIAHIAGAAVSKRKLVVYLCGRRQHAAAEAVLTQWMCMNISVSDAFPLAAVSAVAVWVALIPVVIVPDQLLILWAVLPGCQLFAAGIL